MKEIILYQAKDRNYMSGMGADEHEIINFLAKFGHDPSKERNGRQRYRYGRLIRYTLSKQRIGHQGLKMTLESRCREYYRN